MEDTKTLRARAIIFRGDEIVSMYRERENRVFYSLPGGGAEENETLEDCVKREVLEEFGIIVEPIKQVYIYHNPRSIEYFYICKWISGEFGSGKGEEFSPTQTNGVYTVSTQYPAVQQYAPSGSFGPNSLPMIGQNGKEKDDK